MTNDMTNGLWCVSIDMTKTNYRCNRDEEELLRTVDACELRIVDATRVSDMIFV
ncbi:hypothetical protein Hanom_Chr11g01018211 [Helianthus anomalus]